MQWNDIYLRVCLWPLSGWNWKNPSIYYRCGEGDGETEVKVRWGRSRQISITFTMFVDLIFEIQFKELCLPRRHFIIIFVDFFVIFSLIQCSSWPVYIHIYLFHIGSIIKSLVSAGFVMCMQETWHNTAEQSIILSAYSLAYTIVAVMYPPSIVKPHHNHSHSFISSYTRHHISWHICLLTWTTQHNNIQRGIAPKNSGKQLKNGGKFVYIHFDFFSILISTFLSASISATPTSRVNFSFHIIISRWQIPIKRRLCTGWALLKRFCAVKPSEGWAGKKRILQCEFCEFLEYSWSSATVMEWNQQNYDHIIIHRMASATAARSHLRERPHR